MDDTISRQAAIEALYNEIIKRRLLDDVNDGLLDEFDTEDILRKLPPAEPDKRIAKIEDLVEGTIDHFNLDDALDLLYQIKGVLEWVI